MALPCMAATRLAVRKKCINCNLEIHPVCMRKRSKKRKRNIPYKAIAKERDKVMVRFGNRFFPVTWMLLEQLLLAMS